MPRKSDSRIPLPRATSQACGPCRYLRWSEEFAQVESLRPAKHRTGLTKENLERYYSEWRRPATLVLIPITRPRASASGPPELPGARRTLAWTQDCEPSPGTEQTV